MAYFKAHENELLQIILFHCIQENETRPLSLSVSVLKTKLVMSYMIYELFFVWSSFH